MKWKGRRESTNVRDRRGRRARAGGGAASSAGGPFYCASNQQVYIDPGSYDQLERGTLQGGDTFSIPCGRL